MWGPQVHRELGPTLPVPDHEQLACLLPGGALPPAPQPLGPASGSHTDRGAGRKRFQLLLPDVAASVHPGRFLACAPGETPPAKHSASV